MAASHFGMESGEAPRTGAGQTSSGQAGSATTVPFEVVRRAEFVFEPFVGSLIQLPEVKMQRAQSSEFFLPQSPMQVIETETSAAFAKEAVVWEKPQAAAMAGAEENAVAKASPERAAERESKTARESLRFFEPKRIQFFDPGTLAPQEDGSEEAAASQQDVGRRSSIELSAELKAAILRIDEQRRKRQEENEAQAKEKKHGLLRTPREKRVEAQGTADAISDREAAKRTQGWQEFAEPTAIVSDGVEEQLDVAATADSLQGKTEDEEEPVADRTLETTTKATDAVVASADTERAPWEVELAEALLAQTQVSEEEETPRKAGRLSLKRRLRRWLTGEAEEVSPDANRRRAERMVLPGLVAFYWSGGTPRPHEIVNISRTGFYLHTNDLWSVETLVRMTLVRPRADRKEKRESISVLARVVRIDNSGVGHEFVTTEALTRARSLEVMPSRGTDWRELDKFLDVG